MSAIDIAIRTVAFLAWKGCCRYCNKNWVATCHVSCWLYRYWGISFFEQRKSYRWYVTCIRKHDTFSGTTASEMGKFCLGELHNIFQNTAVFEMICFLLLYVMVLHVLNCMSPGCCHCLKESNNILAMFWTLVRVPNLKQVWGIIFSEKERRGTQGAIKKAVHIIFEKNSLTYVKLMKKIVLGPVKISNLDFGLHKRFQVLLLLLLGFNIDELTISDKLDKLIPVFLLLKIVSLASSRVPCCCNPGRNLVTIVYPQCRASM